MIKTLAQQFISWLDRVVDADERVVCAICDQRFVGFEDGNLHLQHAHPQYAMGGWQPAAVPVYGAWSRPADRSLAQPAYALRAH